jgi:ankyrin repeat protein
MLLHSADANTLLHGKTPLMRAIQCRASNVLELLLSHEKIDLRIQNRERESALTYSCFRNQFDLVLFRLDSRKINPKSTSYDWMLFQGH